MLRLLRECCLEWQARWQLPVRPWLWWAVDSVGDGRQRYLILHAFMDDLWHCIKALGQPPETNRCLAAQVGRGPNRLHI